MGVSLLRQAAAAATDLLFPPRCVCCGAQCESRPNKPLLCNDCDQELAISSRPTCPRCAQACSEVDLARGNCGDCKSRKLLFTEARAIGAYQDLLRTAVLKMKHAVHQPLAIAAGQRLAEVLSERPFPKPPDLVTAVPMHWLNRMWRGMNGPEVVARALARQLHWKFASRLLVCRRRLRRQATLTPTERRENVRNAFRPSRRWTITGQTILLVDDVMTTGATAHEASRALKTAGASEIYLAILARSTSDF
jgi:ComF family protein